MINNPDGTKRLPTKEEILENVRNRQRLISTNNNSSETSIRTNQSAVTEDRRFFGQGRGETYEPERRDRPDESDKGSRNRSNDSIFGATRENGVVDSSSHEYSERIATFTTGERVRQPPIKSSKFKPYADAVRQAFKSQKKEPVQPKTTAKKVLTKQEADNLKEKLIEMLLWQSDHADEIIIATTKGHMPLVIWSDLDRKDATVIANFMLERAKTDKQMAYIVREMIGLKDRIQLALIILPRLYRTFLTYWDRGIGISLR